MKMRKSSHIIMLRPVKQFRYSGRRLRGQIRKKDLQKKNGKQAICCLTEKKQHRGNMKQKKAEKREKEWKILSGKRICRFWELREIMCQTVIREEV